MLPAVASWSRAANGKIVAVASETDTLPIGEGRQHWEAAALRERDHQAAEYLGRVKGVIDDALQKVLLD